MRCPQTPLNPLHHFLIRTVWDSLLKRHYTRLKDFCFKSFPLLSLEHSIFPVPNFQWLPQMFYPFSFTGTSLENRWLHQPPLHPAPPPPTASKCKYQPRSNVCVLQSASYTWSRGWLQFLTSTGIIQFGCILVMPLKCIPNNKCSNFSFIIFVWILFTDTFIHICYSLFD